MAATATITTTAVTIACYILRTMVILNATVGFDMLDDIFDQLDGIWVMGSHQIDEIAALLVGNFAKHSGYVGNMFIQTKDFPYSLFLIPIHSIKEY